MPAVEVIQRHAASRNADVVAVLDKDMHTVTFTWDPVARRSISHSVPTEVCCFSLEQAEQLAPKLMEWLIKRKAGERNASG